ncbi:S8 family peptidase [Sphingomonas solaris]|uniref:S8 family peptidase n=1 Tax=Alterirhizorhabdus solaris TaxID=2529389 RepID=A0A558R9H1_9SPHN|nr:S8 family peptidase [Sphingomonas solaris]TVV76041.1 S8 family peptidase [Sphingomonas solaris]
MPNQEPAASDAARPVSPRTIIYVHGIANKPPSSVLKCQWDTALFGAELGDRSRMCYWVNRDFYPVPLDETCGDPDLVRVDDQEVSTRAVIALATAEPGTETLAIEREVEALADNNSERRRVLQRIAERVVAGGDEFGEGGSDLFGPVSAKVLPLPAFLRRILAGKLTRAFLRDVNDFLYVDARRHAMREAFRSRLDSGGGPFVVVAHSQGSIIAYDVLRELDPARYDVPLLLTVGSPLGMQEVQDELRRWHEGPLVQPACVRRWVNIADCLDPVAIDSDLRGDFPGSLKNVREFGLNTDSPRHPHSATGYLATQIVRDTVLDVVGPAFAQSIAPFVIAKDLVSAMENALPRERQPVLIQLVNEDAASTATLDEAASLVEHKIRKLVVDSGSEWEDAQFDRLRRFVSARLTRKEVETLRSLDEELSIKAMWRNAEKRALIHRSTNTIQAAPANLGYGANGQGIAWAVLDTGIAAGHPHFNASATNLVVEQYDCMSVGPPRLIRPSEKEFARFDGNGHGTHVAAIIAGEHNTGTKAGVETFRGMAPRCRLYGFRVLARDGNGSDASIIKALDQVAQLNENSSRLVIHGVNLSLGGSFDPSVYNCGHTPLCQEIKRLWRQGVLVVLAAGNEGYVVLRSEGGLVQANLDLSIGDPANLEEAIAVGSVHKTNPYTYGISFFSSRGPTADGRAKPDVVAPGERVLSARHDWIHGVEDAPAIDDLYVERSGTSMAAPHVSGLLAAFLSARREFIGEPDRVKRYLMGGCMDLGRDKYMQGAGLPNLIKMLALQVG